MILFDPEAISKVVEERGWRMEHDISYFSMFMGAPILVAGNWIGYHEVDDLNIFNVSLDDGSSLTMKELAMVADYVIETGFSAVDFWGNALLDQFTLPGYDQSTWHDESSNVPMQFDMKRFDIDKAKRQREAKKGQKSGLSGKVRYQAYLTAQHFELLYKFMETHVVPGPDISFVTHADCFTRRVEAMVMEVLNSEGNMCGFGIASQGLKKTLVVHHLFHDGTPFVSDVFYDAIFRYAGRHGFPFVDIGYSIRDSLKGFKIDLGSNLVFPPNFGTRFIRQGTYPRPVHWVLRTLESYKGERHAKPL